MKQEYYYCIFCGKSMSTTPSVEKETYDSSTWRCDCGSELLVNLLHRKSDGTAYVVGFAEKEVVEV
jgi:DNA-directed RNA polymerase subunit RPC12/RpoP